MSEQFNFREWLREWPYDPEHAARVVRGADGREVMQVRTPLGVELYDLAGRPDGARPHDANSALDFQRTRLAQLTAQGKADAFHLNAVACAELFEEGVLYYFRYLHLFQIHDWLRVVRDTQRNLSLFDFVHAHAKREPDRLHLEQWRPYLLRMHAVARAMIDWEAGRHNAALHILRDAMARIEALTDLELETFQYERQRSLEALQELIAQIEKTQPLSQLEQLERDLHKAVESENFERAAALRDHIRTLRTEA